MSESYKNYIISPEVSFCGRFYINMAAILLNVLIYLLPLTYPSEGSYMDNNNNNGLLSITLKRDSFVATVENRSSLNTNFTNGQLKYSIPTGIGHISIRESCSGYYCNLNKEYCDTVQNRCEQCSIICDSPRVSSTTECQSRCGVYLYLKSVESLTRHVGPELSTTRNTSTEMAYKHFDNGLNKTETWALALTLIAMIIILSLLQTVTCFKYLKLKRKVKTCRAGYSNLSTEENDERYNQPTASSNGLHLNESCGMSNENPKKYINNMVSVNDGFDKEERTEIERNSHSTNTSYEFPLNGKSNNSSSQHTGSNMEDTTETGAFLEMETSKLDIDIVEEYKNYKEVLKQMRIPSFIQSSGSDSETNKIYIDITKGTFKKAHDFLERHFKDLIEREIIDITEQKPLEFATDSQPGDELNHTSEGQFTANFDDNVPIAGEYIEEGSRLIAVADGQFNGSICDTYKSIQDVCMAKFGADKPHGTLGGFVADQNGHVYVMSAWHVFKECKKGQTGSKPEQLPILTEISNNQEGKLIHIGSEFHGVFNNEIHSKGVDMSLTRVLPCVLRSPHINMCTSNELGKHVKIEAYKDNDEYLKGMEVEKVGLMTGKTYGKIVSVAKDLNIEGETWGGCFLVASIPSNRSSRITQENFALKGDSGALVKKRIGPSDEETIAVGMVFKLEEDYKDKKTGEIYRGLAWCVGIKYCFRYAEEKWQLRLNFVNDNECLQQAEVPKPQDAQRTEVYKRPGIQLHKPQTSQSFKEHNQQYAQAISISKEYPGAVSPQQNGNLQLDTEETKSIAIHSNDKITTHNKQDPLLEGSSRRNPPVKRAAQDESIYREQYEASLRKTREVHAPSENSKLTSVDSGKFSTPTSSQKSLFSENYSETAKTGIYGAKPKSKPNSNPADASVSPCGDSSFLK